MKYRQPRNRSMRRGDSSETRPDEPNVLRETRPNPSNSTSNPQSTSSRRATHFGHSNFDNRPIINDCEYQNQMPPRTHGMSTMNSVLPNQSNRGQGNGARPRRCHYYVGVINLDDPSENSPGIQTDGSHGAPNASGGQYSGISAAVNSSGGYGSYHTPSVPISTAGVNGHVQGSLPPPSYQINDAMDTGPPVFISPPAYREREDMPAATVRLCKLYREMHRAAVNLDICRRRCAEAQSAFSANYLSSYEPSERDSETHQLPHPPCDNWSDETGCIICQHNFEFNNEED